MNLYCLHGFLGCASDFDFLKPDYNIHALELDELVDKSLSDIDDLIIGEDITLLGYSFGSRLALRLLALNPKKYQKVFCFAGHLGLSSHEDRHTRKGFEDKMITALKENSMHDFLKMWNSYDIFKGDMPIRSNTTDKSIIIKYFENWGLSKQEYLKDKLILERDKINFYYGELDKKYVNYAKNELSSFNVTIVKNCGHRLIQNQEFISKEINRYVKECN
jgi:pimeloyl-ACP methyl ester carboxylesterase